MKKLLAIPCLMVLLAACGETSTQGDTTVEDNSLATVQSELAYIQCGFGCNPGDYPYGYQCTGSGCGGGAACPVTGDPYTSVNSTGCNQITSAPYEACGLGDYLSAGHYIAGYKINRYCDAVTSSNGGTVPNMTGYGKLPTPGTQAFFNCSLGCPSGYSVIRHEISRGCNPSGTTPTSPNATWCM